MTRTAAASALALPNASRPITGRRRFLSALASLPIVGMAGAALFTSKADAAAATIVQMIEDGQARCLATEKAFADALATYEASLPRMHRDLDFSKRLISTGLRVPLEQGFNGAHVTRGERHSSGSRFPRYIVTSAFCREQIKEYAADARARRYIGRLLRRAQRYEAALARLEERLCLQRLSNEKLDARRDFEKLGVAVFANRGRTRAAVYAQARMLCATQAVATQEHSFWQAQQWGITLAEAVRDLGRAA